MPADPRLTEREQLRKQALHSLRAPASHPLAEAELLRGVGLALTALATPDYAVTAMRNHAAEHDCVLELRLIDVSTFAVRCARHREFTLEWSS